MVLFFWCFYKLNFFGLFIEVQLLTATMQLLRVLVVFAVLWQSCVAQVQLKNVYTYIGRGFDLVTGKLIIETNSSFLKLYI
jgi:hypothetical protein